MCWMGSSETNLGVLTENNVSVTQSLCFQLMQLMHVTLATENPRPKKQFQV